VAVTSLHFRADASSEQIRVVQVFLRGIGLCLAKTEKGEVIICGRDNFPVQLEAAA